MSRARCASRPAWQTRARARGVPIYRTDLAAATSRLRVLVTGAIHGDELSAASVALHWLHLARNEPMQMPQPVHWRFVPMLNPDGVLAQPPRRTNANGVDLNRNFHDYSRPLPQNTAYRELHPLLVPAKWPPGLLNKASIAWCIARRGMKTMQAAISGGQYEFADGLFYGGREPTWSNVTLRQVLRRR